MATNISPTAPFPREQRNSTGRDSGGRLSFLDVQAVVLYALGMFGFGLILTLERSLSLPERALTVPYRLLMLLVSVAIVVTVLAKSKRFLLRSYLFPLAIFWLAYIMRFVVDVFVRELPLAQAPSDLFFYIIGMCLVPMTAMLLHSSERSASAAVLTSLVVLGLACAAILLFCRDILFTDFGRLRAEGGLNQIIDDSQLVFGIESPSGCPGSAPHLGYLDCVWAVGGRSRFFARAARGHGCHVAAVDRLCLVSGEKNHNTRCYPDRYAFCSLRSAVPQEPRQQYRPTHRGDCGAD
jgi:hypothetical protein